MGQITISKSAVDKILLDPKVIALRERSDTNIVPYLRHYRRSYSTLNDGRVIEHGDGFTFSFVDAKEIEDTPNIAHETVKIADGVNIVVGGPCAILSGPVTIGWSDKKFTLERQTSS